MECIHRDECSLPPFYMKRGGKKRRETKREIGLTLHSLVGANLLDSSGRHVVAVLLLVLVLVGIVAEESYSCLRNRAASQW